MRARMQMGAAACAAGAGRQWSAEHGGRAAACEERAAAAPARRPVVVPWKKPRLEQRSGSGSGSGSSTTILPSFEVQYSSTSAAAGGRLINIHVLHRTGLTHALLWVVRYGKRS
jgi:hypothetical protein